MTFSLSSEEGGRVLAALWKDGRNVKARCIGRRCELFDAKAPDDVLFYQDFATAPSPGSTITWTVGDFTWQIEVDDLQDLKRPPGVDPSRLLLFGDGWTEGLPIMRMTREGETLRVEVQRPHPIDVEARGPWFWLCACGSRNAKSIALCTSCGTARPPQAIDYVAAKADPVGMTTAGVQQLAALSVDDLLARYRDGQLDAQAVAALAHKARGAEQLQTQLKEAVPTATGQVERLRRDVAQNHVNASAASVVAELGAACCCGLHLPGRVVRAVRDLAWRLATLKAVRK